MRMEGNSISLKEFAWDKEHATLTIPNKTLCDGGHWAGDHLVTVLSHVTLNTYTFKWDKSFKDSVWKLFPLDDKCPIKVIYVLDSNLGRIWNKTPYVEEASK